MVPDGGGWWLTVADGGWLTVAHSG
jgi:hypothetical protein